MERLIRIDEVMRITSLSKSDITRRMKAKEFPEKIKLGPRRVAWVLSEVRAWVRSVSGSPQDEELPADSEEEHSPIARYLDRIAVQDDGCWIWLGAKGDKYGLIKAPGTRKNKGAHRIIYEAIKGKIPDGLELDHKCRVTMCVNPDHLEPVTRQVNMQRSHRDRVKIVKTHCKRGHEYTPENTVTNQRGNRHCKQCAKINYEERKKRNAND